MLANTPISNAKSYQEIGAFWDEQDATEFGGQTEAEFIVNIQSQRRYFSLDNLLAEKLKTIARHRGIHEETLLNLWVQEKLNQSAV
jgi:hypothetical protein